MADKTGKMADTTGTKQAERGDMLTYLGGKLMGLAQRRAEYAVEAKTLEVSMRNLDASQEQTEMDIGCIFEALETCDWVVMRKLADGWRQEDAERAMRQVNSIPF